MNFLDRFFKCESRRSGFLKVFHYLTVGAVAGVGLAAPRAGVGGGLQAELEAGAVAAAAGVRRRARARVQGVAQDPGLCKNGEKIDPNMAKMRSNSNRADHATWRAGLLRMAERRFCATLSSPPWVSRPLTNQR